MSWLITGGAGYIGAHVVAAMRAAGERAVVLDDLSTGDAGRLPADVPLVTADVADTTAVTRALAEHGVTGVVHLAAKKQVEQSVQQPLTYYRENVEGLRALLEAVVEGGVQAFLFSSSAAVYGAPDVDLVGEDTPCLPVNPYGRTKLIGEQMLADLAAAAPLRYACLRYFNVAGTATPELADRGAANLVPMVMERLEAGRAPLVFGDDYATPDGTCVRDFIHVADIASAHVAVAQAIADGRVPSLTANIGRGEGQSVRQVIDAILAVSGHAADGWAQPEVRPRRAGDPARVVADASRLRDLLGWSAAHDLHDMVASAWAARQARG